MKEVAGAGYRREGGLNRKRFAGDSSGILETRGTAGDAQ